MIQIIIFVSHHLTGVPTMKPPKSPMRGYQSSARGGYSSIRNHSPKEPMRSFATKLSRSSVGFAANTNRPVDRNGVPMRGARYERYLRNIRQFNKMPSARALARVAALAARRSPYGMLAAAVAGVIYNVYDQTKGPSPIPGVSPDGLPTPSRAGVMKAAGFEMIYFDPAYPEQVAKTVFSGSMPNVASLSGISVGSAKPQPSLNAPIPAKANTAAWQKPHFFGYSEPYTSTQYRFRLNEAFARQFGPEVYPHGTTPSNSPIVPPAISPIWANPLTFPYRYPEHSPRSRPNTNRAPNRAPERGIVIEINPSVNPPIVTRLNPKARRPNRREKESKYSGKRSAIAVMAKIAGEIRDWRDWTEILYNNVVGDKPKLETPQEQLLWLFQNVASRGVDWEEFLWDMAQWYVTERFYGKFEGLASSVAERLDSHNTFGISRPHSYDPSGEGSEPVSWMFDRLKEFFNGKD